MLKISFTNAEVSDHGYGLEVNGKSLEDIISTALGTKLTLRDNAGEDPVVALAIVDQSIDKGWKDLYPLKNYGRQGKPTAVSKKFSGNTLKDAEGKDIVF